MHKLLKNFRVASVLCSLVILSIGCSSSQNKALQEQKSETKSTQANANLHFSSSDPNALPTPDNQGKGFTAGAMQDEASLLVGVWRMSYQGPVCMAQGEMVFQPNGIYSGLSQCPDGSYVTHLTGTWQLLQPGTIRLQYDNARDENGRLRHPEGETFYFRFLDRNRMALSGNIIAYRAG